MTPELNRDPKKRPRRQLEENVRTQGGGVCCVRMPPLRPGCSTRGHCRPPYRNIVKIGFSSSLFFFPQFLQITPTQYHITVDSFCLSMMKLFSRRAEIDLTRCWAPGLERSFRSFWINWESAVVTDRPPVTYRGLTTDYTTNLQLRIDS